MSSTLIPQSPSLWARTLLCTWFLVGVCCLVGMPAALAQEASVLAMAERIDEHLRGTWEQDGVVPAEPASDAEFCRRVWLDLAGVAPPVSVLRTFLSDTAPDKHDRLIASLLASPQYAAHMAERWNRVLVPADQADMPVDTRSLKAWLRKQFQRNLSYDNLVAEFLVAGGPADSGPAVFYTSHDLEPKKLAAATARIFLGIQLQCAECHDHPFDRWKQTDFWSYAAFFSQLKQRQAGRGQWIEDLPGGEVRLPESQLVSVPMYPGVPEPPEPDVADYRRRQLTIWLASRDNPYLARAAVNRVWEHLFGRGLVHPVDAMDADNPASHPKLLQELSDYFVEQRFDLRKLYQTLASTKAYRMSSAYSAGERPAMDTFAVMNVKTLSPQQYYDSLMQNVLRVPPPWDDANSANSPEQAMRQAFLNRMGSGGAAPVDYPHGVLQALGTMNGPELQRASLQPQNGLLAVLDAPFYSDVDRIETLYLATVSRLPTKAEQQRCSKFLADIDSPAETAAVRGDLLWALLCSTECAVCP
ncbi:DUF1549 domain-containing protein [Roseimaritima ulvae]|uniref:DUF1549 domain-containing protein n=1 Tax=Roseimaritima ulvae TaxID=980254 RepID=A0A5B9QRS8_9BACT|nr:DUF1549 domain-containing protein [Roseimaritima ulvae]QEG40662.1 hypothetical protein UC8_26790 [Roseimaritima ulvae]